MKLSTAAIACLSQRTLRGLIDAGCISKGDLAAINALRAGDPSGRVAFKKIASAVSKQFSGRGTLERAVFNYARERAEQMMKERPMSMIEKMLGMSEEVMKMVAQADGIPSVAHGEALIAEVAKRRQASGEIPRHFTKEQAYSAVVTDGGLGNLLMHKVQELRRGWRLPAKDGIEMADSVAKLVDHPMRKLGGGSLPQERAGTMRTTHNTGPGSTNNPGDENFVESADAALQRIAAVYEANGATHSAAVLRAATSAEYSRAQRAETQRKFGV